MANLISNKVLNIFYGEVQFEIHSESEFISPEQTSPPTLHRDIYACLKYQDPVVKKALFDLKYRKNQSLANIFAKLLFEKIASLCTDREIVLVPIPPHKKRIHEYGFSQTVLLAEAIITFSHEYLSTEKHAHPISVQNILIYSHNTSDHKLKNRSERLSDAKNQFTISENMHNLLENKYIIIIDDIITTGSTCLDAMRACREAGATQVIACAVAH